MIRSPSFSIDANGWSQLSASMTASRHSKSVATVTQIGILPRVETTTLEDGHCTVVTGWNEDWSSDEGNISLTTHTLTSTDVALSSSTMTRLSINGGKIVLGGAYSTKVDRASAVTKSRETDSWYAAGGTSSTTMTSLTLGTSGSTDVGGFVGRAGPGDEPGGWGARVGKRTAYANLASEFTHEYHVDNANTRTNDHEFWRDVTSRRSETSYGLLGATTTTSGQSIAYYVAHDLEGYNNNPGAPLEGTNDEYLAVTNLVTNESSVLIDRRRYMLLQSLDPITYQYIEEPLGSRPLEPALYDDIFTLLGGTANFFTPPDFVDLSFAKAIAAREAIAAQPPPPAGGLDNGAGGAHDGSDASGEPVTIAITCVGCATTYLDAPDLPVVRGGFWSGVSDVAFNIGRDWYVQATNLGASIPEFFSGYFTTAASGEQASSLSGYVDRLTDWLNPFGGGTSFGPAYGQNEAYEGGTGVGSVAALTINAVLMVTGLQGLAAGLTSLWAGGGLLKVGSAALAGGGSVPWSVTISGAALALAPGLAINGGLAAAGFANLTQALMSGGGAELRPYGGRGGGHHVPAKSAFEGAAGYSAKEALAIPNAELARLGIRHSLITAEQQSLYRAFAQTGRVLTWGAVEEIETQALIRGGMGAEQALATVRAAIQALKNAGVSGPTRIPWGG